MKNGLAKIVRIALVAIMPVWLGIMILHTDTTTEQIRETIKYEVRTEYDNTLREGT